ncbi:TauD/TfdA family dioxygenase [Streptomyces sp. NPDC052236]|uniref:TauD/TfdA family dioxygenase n=1 Tax=Streptomyces sp. NPDC052236 TaxID=3365686 RepID=UPI0037D64206
MKTAVRFLAGHLPWHPIRDADGVRLEAETLPIGLRRFLVGARADEAEVVTLANLPVQACLGPTPADWQAAEAAGAGALEEVVLLLCASIMGDPVAWESQQNGRLVHDVCPSKGQEESLTSASSKAGLTLHTEDVFHACRGDYVALMCLRNPDPVGTTVARVDASALSARTRAVLRESRFRFYADDSHVPDCTNGLEERPYETAPVLFGPSDSPYVRMDADFTGTAPDDDAAAAALRECAELLHQDARKVVLRAGEAVFLDNYRVVHGRDVFAPRYDGTDRWLKRTNIVRDLRRLYVHTNSRSRLLV